MGTRGVAPCCNPQGLQPWNSAGGISLNGHNGTPFPRRFAKQSLRARSPLSRGTVMEEAALTGLQPCLNCEREHGALPRAVIRKAFSLVAMRRDCSEGINFRNDFSGDFSAALREFFPTDDPFPRGNQSHSARAAQRRLKLSARLPVGVIFTKPPAALTSAIPAAMSQRFVPCS